MSKEQSATLDVSPHGELIKKLLAYIPVEGQAGIAVRDALMKEAANAIAALHERLEDSYYFDWEGNRVECAPGSIPDGISCRDETIKLQDQAIDKFRSARSETACREQIDFAIEKEACRWAERLNWIHAKYDVDGSGTESGDALDVIEAEIRLVLGKLEEQTTPSATRPILPRIGENGKHPRMFYWEDTEDCWCPADGLELENIIGIDNFFYDKQEIEIRFKREDMTDAEFEAIPEG